MLMLFLVTVIALDYFRVEHGIRIPFFYIMYRKNEADRFGDHIFFALGAISVIALFTREIAYASILMATFGDLAAALIEKFYGKRRVFQTIFKNDKSVEGSSSEFIIDFLIGLLILGNPIVSLVMAFLATLRKPHPIKLTITSWYQFSPVFSGRLL